MLSNIAFETTSNPHCREYHTRVKLTADILDLVRTIRGVAEVSSRTRYNMTVTKGQLFEWEEVGPAIQTFIQTFFSEIPE